MNIIKKKIRQYVGNQVKREVERERESQVREIENRVRWQAELDRREREHKAYWENISKQNNFASSTGQAKSDGNTQDTFQPVERKKIKMTLEYIWIGGKGEIRSKTRVAERWSTSDGLVLEDWTYDASSTGQAKSDGNTEGILKPGFHVYKNPLRKSRTPKGEHFLVLCGAYNINNVPLETNHRHCAEWLFSNNWKEEPWFGLEQEYFIGMNDKQNVFEHYCGVGRNIERKIAEEHLALCLEAGLTISGINAEVATEQWEFQIGPCQGVEAADQLIVARYLLERVAEKYNVKICYDPKPSETANGSGCHTNFSTKKMREKNGIEEIYRAINKLEKKHDEHIKLFGEGNELRLTGEHETASYKTFSWGIGTRNTSIRIPNQVVKDKCGYFEDRRPAANMDPYLVTYNIFKTCCLE